MDYLRTGIVMAEKFSAKPSVRRCLATYKKHYKDAFLWTHETGCLVFTSLIIYFYVLGGSSSSDGESATLLDKIVTCLFIMGAMSYIALSSIFRKLSRLAEDNMFLNFLKVANKYLFVLLSFIPGIYFAFEYDEIILRFYMVIHLVTTGYFFYKRMKEFQMIPFLIGLGMSFALGSIGPSIRFFFGLFGSGWFPTTCAATLETLVNTSMALAFMFRIPEKYLPSTMLFGLKIVKYLMFFFSLKTFFIIMVITSWKNIGAGVLTFMEIYFKPNSKVNDSSKIKNDKAKSN